MKPWQWLLGATAVILGCSCLNQICFEQGRKQAIRSLIRNKYVYFNGKIYLVKDTGQTYTPSVDEAKE